MSLYPSLEDMKVDQMMRAQLESSNVAHVPYSTAALPFAYPTAPMAYSPNNTQTLPANDTLYPTLDDYMGLSLTSQELAVLQQPMNAMVVSDANRVIVGDTSMVAPLSSASLGLQRANVTHGIREVILCKDKDGKVGMRVQAINKGVFVAFVQSNSPAAMVGLRFGDQILQINNEIVAGYSKDKVHDMVRKASVNNINLVIRDRPFERTVTLHKGSLGNVGFTFKNGKINAIVKDSSAARNGLLIEHNLLEINGQNVIGIEDKGIRQLIESGGDIITVTIMPSFLYEHMMKQMATNLVKKLMDHSIPDI